MGQGTATPEKTRGHEGGGGAAGKPPFSRLALVSLAFAAGAWGTLLVVFIALARGAHIRDASEVVAIAALFVCVALGVVCGGIAVWVVWRSGGRLRGYVVALAAILLSIAALLAPPVLFPAREEPVKGPNCRVHLKTLGNATHVWVEKFGGGERYPPSLRDLHYSGIIHEPKLFLCPRSGRKPETGRFLSDYESAMERAGFTITESMDKHYADVSDVPLAWSKANVHPNGFSVVYFDGFTAFIPDDDGTARRKFLAEVDAWIEKQRPKE